MGERQTRIIRQAILSMGESTPLSIDCGVLCGGICCRGNETMGMWVFPGEKPLLSSFAVQQNADNQVVVCTGHCKREERPLSCRIFPLYPMVFRSKRTGKWQVKAMPDPRALRICPLFREGTEITREFQRAVRRMGKILCKDRELRRYLVETTEFLTYLYEVRGRLE